MGFTGKRARSGLKTDLEEGVWFSLDSFVFHVGFSSCVGFPAWNSEGKGGDLGLNHLKLVFMALTPRSVPALLPSVSWEAPGLENGINSPFSP